MKLMMMDCGDHGVVNITANVEEKKDEYIQGTFGGGQDSPKKTPDTIQFERIRQTVATTAKSLKDMIDGMPEKYIPDFARVEFNVNIGVKEGIAFAYLGQEENGSPLCKVCFEWEKLEDEEELEKDVLKD